MSKVKILIIVLVVLIAIIAAPIVWYSVEILPVYSGDGNTADIELTVPLGTGSGDIAKILKDKNVIRDENAFKIYIKINGVNNFQAGTYYLKQSMGLKEITDMLGTGKVGNPNQINITFIEGKNISWLADTIAEKTNNTADDVYNTLKDKTYITSLISQYWFLTSDIENSDIYYPLEGYLFPDTYTFANKDVTVQEIFTAMLDQESKVLSKYISNDADTVTVNGHQYTIHQIITIASIVESEATNDAGRKGVASVIYNRLNSGMAVQSDATTYYAFKINMGDSDLTQKQLNTYNPYNTRRSQYEWKAAGPDRYRLSLRKAWKQH